MEPQSSAQKTVASGGGSNKVILQCAAAAATATAATSNANPPQPTTVSSALGQTSSSSSGGADVQSQTVQTQPSPKTLYPHQISGKGGPTATAPFLEDFCLVAEAAKRAEMSVIMRDMEGISL